MSKLLDELEAKARAATPGPWIYDDRESGVSPFVACIKTSNLGFYVARGYPTTNTEYIAAAYPDVVLKLVAVARAAEKLASYIEECYPGLSVTETIRELLKELE